MLRFFLHWQRRDVLLLLVVVLLLIGLIQLTNLPDELNRLGSTLSLQTTDKTCLTLQNAEGWNAQFESYPTLNLVNERFDFALSATLVPRHRYDTLDGDFEALALDLGLLEDQQELTSSFTYDRSTERWLPFFVKRSTPVVGASESKFGDHIMAITATVWQDYVVFFSLIDDGREPPTTSQISELRRIAINAVPGCYVHP